MTDAFTVRKGRIFYLECFWDHDEALECLGLSGQDAHAGSEKLQHEIAFPGEIREDKVARVRIYLSWEEGLKAVGLER
jgi:hypothetical protein